MNIKALITTLVIVGSSSVAMARPATAVSSTSASVNASASWSFGYSTPTVRPTVRDHRTNTRYRPAHFQTWGSDQWNDRNRTPRYDVLGDNLNFGNGEYRKDIMPGGVDQFSTLKIDADQGRTYIMKVVVEFADGTAQQQINLDRTLRAGESLTLDLTGRSHTISRILVYRADSYDTSHLDRAHRGSFTVSAL